MGQCSSRLDAAAVAVDCNGKPTFKGSVKTVETASSIAEDAIALAEDLAALGSSALGSTHEESIIDQSLETTEEEEEEEDDDDEPASYLKRMPQDRSLQPNKARPSLRATKEGTWAKMFESTYGGLGDWGSLSELDNSMSTLGDKEDISVSNDDSLLSSTIPSASSEDKQDSQDSDICSDPLNSSWSDMNTSLNPARSSIRRGALPVNNSPSSLLGRRSSVSTVNSWAGMDISSSGSTLNPYGMGQQQRRSRDLSPPRRLLGRRYSMAPSVGTVSEDGADDSSWNDSDLYSLQSISTLDLAAPAL